MQQIITSLLLLLTITATSQVKVGVEVLRDSQFAALTGKRVGLITNPTGVDSNMNSTIDILFQADQVKLVALYAPEHGVRGDILGGDVVGATTDASTGLKVHSLFGKTNKPTAEMLSGIDALVFDIQDIGSRSYTYITTMGLAMEAAAENGIEFIVLDRPNPLGGLKVEGNGVTTGFYSFVSKYNIPYIHGMTVGEIATMLNDQRMLKNGAKCRLTVVPLHGWKRSMNWSETGRLWVPTSPHIPSWESAYYYPITGMIGELGTIDIGVGYTLPFQTFAAEWVSSAEEVALALNDLQLSGVEFRPINYTPFYGPSKGRPMRGVQVYISNLEDARLTMIPFYVVQELVRLYPTRSPFTAATAARISMFDKVMGGSEVRQKFVSSGHRASAISSIWDSHGAWFLEIRKKHLLY